MMQYLYHGGVRALQVEGKDVLELLGAANFFMLDGLQRHCEVLCSLRLNTDNCTSIYKHAKVRAHLNRVLSLSVPQLSVSIGTRCIFAPVALRWLN